MARPSTHLRRLAGATAVSLAFVATGNAAGLADDVAAQGQLMGSLSVALTALTSKEALPNLRAGGFTGALRDALGAPSDKTRVVDYPPRANADLLRVLAVVPPKGFEQLPIPVCAEKDNKVLGTWTISPNGQLTAQAWAGSRVSERPTSSACRDFIFAARAAIDQKLAAAAPGGTPAQPPPTAGATIATISMASRP